SCSGGACVFSNNAVPCDDGNECTSDVCGGGSCIGTNLLEGTSCSVGYCEDGSCRTCFIGGEVYANGELNPSNACQRCDSSNPTSWTNLADGSNCGGTPGKCCAGVCDSDGLTTNDVLHGDCRNGPMCVGVGQWGFFRLAEGTPCSVNGFCEDNGGNGCVEPACFFNGEVYAASEEVSRDCDAGGQAGSACGVQTGVCNSDQSVGSWGGCFLKASSECFTGVSEPCEVGGVYGWQSCTNCFLSASCALPDTGERVNAISVECPRIVVEDSFVVKGTAIIDGIPKCVDSIVVSGPGTPVVSLSCSEPVSSADVGNVVNGSYTLTFTSGAEEKTCVVKQIVVETTTGAPDFSLLLLPAFAAIALALLRRRKVS
ncbi:MAG: hypothetical protein ACE5DI_06045, partial [Candidatus Micrarchaeia archaeon]